MDSLSQSVIVETGHGTPRRGVAWQVKGFFADHFESRLGKAALGKARHGEARRGFLFRRPHSKRAWHGGAGPGSARRGKGFFLEMLVREVPCSGVKLDYAIHPRGELSQEHIERLAAAIRKGESLPPIVVCERSRRVVDGFHRYSAHVLTGGKRCLISIVEKRYRGESELFLDAIRYNASHGARIEESDYAKCMEVALRLEVDLSSVAGILHIPVGRLGELRVLGNGNDIRRPLEKNNGGNGGYVPVLSVRSSRSTHPTGYSFRQSDKGVLAAAKRIIRAIDSDSMDLETEGLWNALDALHDKLAAFLYPEEVDK